MSLIVSNLTCEYRVNPLGIDVLQPRMSWQLESNQRGTRQTAYRILAAWSEEGLSSDAVFWDSGKVLSDRSIHMLYEAQDLYPANVCTGKYRYGMMLGRKRKVSLPGGK